jgi:hypothetical protein
MGIISNSNVAGKKKRHARGQTRAKDPKFETIPDSSKKQRLMDLQINHSKS